MKKDLISLYYKDLVSSKEKENAVKTICKMEKINSEANKRIRLYLKSQMDKNKDYETTEEYKKLLINAQNKHFSDVLNSLDPINYLIILNNYIKQNTNKDWTDEYFSKTTYYKKRKSAIEEFLYLYFA